LGNQTFGFLQDVLLLLVTCAPYRLIDRKPLHPIDLAIMVFRISIGELEQEECDDFENSGGRPFPLGGIGILDGIDRTLKFTGESCFFSRLSLCRNLGCFTAFDEAFRQGPRVSLSRLDQYDFGHAVPVPIDYTTCRNLPLRHRIQILQYRLMDLFTSSDFKIFDIAGFNERMAAIMLNIRPKLTSIGETLAPKVSLLVDRTLFVHVAKHARRTVNPPDDTWAALGPDQRGYKKDVHFKVAVSRHCVRFLFEVGPEYYAKPEWAAEWIRSFKEFGSGLNAAGDLGWFKSEHDEAASASLKDLAAADLKRLGEELTRRRDGQLVFGRRVPVQQFTGMNPKQTEKIALETFKPLAPLFDLHSARARVKTQLK